MSGKCILAVGQQQFLVTARVKRLLLAVNLSQLCNQVCKFAVKFTFLLYGDGGTQRFIAGVGALSLNAPFAAVIDGWNSGQSEEADVYGEQVLLQF